MFLYSKYCDWEKGYTSKQPKKEILPLLTDLYAFFSYKTQQVCNYNEWHAEVPPEFFLFVQHNYFLKLK